MPMPDPAGTDRMALPLSFSFPAHIKMGQKPPAVIIREICEKLDQHPAVLVSGVDEAAGTALAANIPDGGFDPAASVFFVPPMEKKPSGALIVTAGKEDLPLALECKYALDCCGWESQLLQTAGVTDLKRLIREADRLCSATACVVIADTDTALPGIIANLTAAPVIALPGRSGLSEILRANANGITAAAPRDAFGAGCAVARTLYRK